MGWEGVNIGIPCPFTGRPILACLAGSAWVAVSEGPGGGWVSTPFRSQSELRDFFVAMPRRAPGEPRAKVDRTCPMMGAPIVARQTGNFNWVASCIDGRGRGYTTTAFYSERHLDYFLSTRAGVPPLFNTDDVQVRERKPPRPDLVLAEAKSRQQEVAGHVEEIIDKVGLANGILVPKSIVGPATHTGRGRGVSSPRHKRGAGAPSGG